ncbi:hypothetical protein OHB53_11300 [Streptomyces sp. NBC_00056]|uniref:hypothetical protein n=1 Tax=Streptomyces sp. NBC_00056 TaxID=2975633 RepID=UPI00324D0B1C
MSDFEDPICPILVRAVVRGIEKLNAVGRCCARGVTADKGRRARSGGRCGLDGHRGFWQGLTRRCGEFKVEEPSSGPVLSMLDIPRSEPLISDVRLRGSSSDFDLPETAVRLRVSQTEDDAGEKDGLTSSEGEELAALRQENRRLREDFGILKRATAFFAKGTR